MVRAGILLLCLAAPLAADSVLLKSGIVIQGRIVSQDSQTIVIETEAGRRALNKPDVMRIRYGNAPIQAVVTPVTRVDEPPRPAADAISEYAGISLEAGAGLWATAFSEHWSQYRFFVVTERGQTPGAGDFTLRGADQNPEVALRGIAIAVRRETWDARLRHRFLRAQPEHTLYQGVDAPLTSTQTLAVHPISLAPLTRHDSAAEASRVLYRSDRLRGSAGAGYRVEAQRARLIRDGVSTSMDLATGAGSSSLAWNIDNNIRHRSAGFSVHADIEYRLTDKLSAGVRPGFYRLHGSWGLKEENLLIPGGFAFGNELESSTRVTGKTLETRLTWLLFPDVALRAGLEIDSARIFLRNVRMSGAYSVRLSAAGITASHIHPLQAVTDSIFLNGPFFTERLSRREETRLLSLSVEKRFLWK